MAKKVYVTSAQKNAARMVVQRSAATGRTVSHNVQKIADAKTGRWASRNPTTGRSGTIETSKGSAVGRFAVRKKTTKGTNRDK